MSGFRVGVDIGGTFTDIVFLGADGTVHTKKISSSVEDYAQAIADGLDQAFGETGRSAAHVEDLRHGTTVASNAILEATGARTGLITNYFLTLLALLHLLSKTTRGKEHHQSCPPGNPGRLRRIVGESKERRA